MKIDFHHAATYVIARIAGFEPRRAEVIAYAAQYVDDATHRGVIAFDNGAMYERTSSAHKTIDRHNAAQVDNRKVWIPFHFLPGNAGLPPGQAPAGSFIHRLVCLPGDRSPVAARMLDSTIAERDAVYGLHRLGIAMHVYADTWAHQGFTGTDHAINSVTHFSCRALSAGEQFALRLLPTFTPELGHAEAATAPDEPYLKWSYVNGLGKTVERDNPTEFLAAAHNMCKAMQRFLEPSLTHDQAPGLPAGDKEVFAGLLRLADKQADNRYDAWARELSSGTFSCGPDNIPHYDERAWKQAALGTTETVHTYHYDANFLHSNWKHFHDGLLRHRFVVLHEILPDFGICAI